MDGKSREKVGGAAGVAAAAEAHRARAMSSLRELASSGAGVKVYQISGSKSIPEWERLSSDRARRKLRQRDEELQRHLELVQGLTFDAACSSLSATPDGNYLLAAGYHPPTIKCYDLNELSLKVSARLTLAPSSAPFGARYCRRRRRRRFRAHLTSSPFARRVHAVATLSHERNRALRGARR